MATEMPRGGPKNRQEEWFAWMGGAEDTSAQNNETSQSDGE